MLATMTAPKSEQNDATRGEDQSSRCAEGRAAPHEPEASAREVILGYGNCSISGCPCPAYKDSYGSNLCGNCGHKYEDHW